MWPFTRRPKPLPPRDFHAPEGVRLYAVGDIHGKADALALLMAAIDADANEYRGQIVEVFLGDYIDRGMHSHAVIEQLIMPPKVGRERICLMGNHERTLLDFIENPHILRDWMQFGGLATLASYGVFPPSHVNQDASLKLQSDFLAAFPQAHEDFLRQLQMHYECGDYYFVHAGIRPNVELAAQSEKDQLWIRSEFIDHTRYYEKYIVHGHTPTQSPELLAHRANLDVSLAEPPALCALRIEGNQRKLININL